MIQLLPIVFFSIIIIAFYCHFIYRSNKQFKTFLKIYDSPDEVYFKEYINIKYKQFKTINTFGCILCVFLLMILSFLFVIKLTDKIPKKTSPDILRTEIDYTYERNYRNKELLKKRCYR